MKIATCLAGILACALGFRHLQADEGMWLFDEFPKPLVAQKHRFQVTDAFLDHLRLASVRFNNGGSGSFISPRGLLSTNHHVGADCIQKISAADQALAIRGSDTVGQVPGLPPVCPSWGVPVIFTSLRRKFSMQYL